MIPEYKPTDYFEVLTVLEELVKLGWNIVALEDEDEDDGWLWSMQSRFSPQEAYDHVMNLDDCKDLIQKDGGKNRFLYFVLGNEPGTALSDYSADVDDIETVSDFVYENYSKEYSYYDIQIRDKEIERLKAELEK